MRGKKKKGSLIKPTTNEAMAAHLLHKLKEAAPGIELPADNSEANINQSEFSYFSETTNEETATSKTNAFDEKLSVDMKEINIEASLEQVKKTSNSVLSIAEKKQLTEKPIVTPRETISKENELAKDVMESKS